MTACSILHSNVIYLLESQSQPAVIDVSSEGFTPLQITCSASVPAILEVCFFFFWFIYFCLPGSLYYNAFGQTPTALS